MKKSWMEDLFHGRVSKNQMRISIILVSFLIPAVLFCQAPTREDTLRGSITPERAWWDVLHYDLEIELFPERQFILGSNTITFQVLSSGSSVMQLELQAPLSIQRIEHDGKSLDFTRSGYFYFVQVPALEPVGAIHQIQIFYSGQPKIAENPPWDGGISWSSDSSGKPFIATSCQGIGASIWWPCKDHPYDEPDSMRMSFTVPGKLVAVGNGRLQSVSQNKNRAKTYVWKVKSPINKYGVNMNVADYVHFSDTYDGENGVLDLDYYVLRENLSIAKNHFQQVKGVLEAFEFWLGPYPFYQDSYKMVEVPYLGMEHQSSVTYGNGYQNGYRGMDMSYTGWGQTFDYIIIHETAHEWFANNITHADVADLWIHEAFATYSESLYVEYHNGKDAGAEYIRGLRMNITDEDILIGSYGVNKEAKGDIYSKGSNVIHTLRQWVRNDSKWRQLLRTLNDRFRHSVISSEELEEFIASTLDLDLDKFFDQYLRDPRLPILEYRIIGNSLNYRWINTVDGFDMPVDIGIDGEIYRIYPFNDHSSVENNEWSYNTLHLSKTPASIQVDPNYLVGTFKLTD